MSAPNIADIQAILLRAQRRVRWQRALERGTTAVVVAATLAVVSVFALRMEWIGSGAAVGAIGLAGALVIAAVAMGLLSRTDDEDLARRVDRASGLADRLSTAIAFDRDLRAGRTADLGEGDEATTRELMQAAIADGVRAVPKAQVVAATPIQRPRDLNAAIGFVLASALVAGLVPHVASRDARVDRADQGLAPPGATVVLRGAHLTRGYESATASVYLGDDGAARPTTIVTWTDDAITIKLPPDAPLGDTHLAVYLKRKEVGVAAFTVVDPRDQAFHGENTVVMNRDDLEYARNLLAELKQTAKDDQIEALDDFIAKIEKLLDQAEKGEITKEQLLEALQQAQDEWNKGADPDQKQIEKDLQDTGKELEQNPMTKDLALALEKNDLEKAGQEMEKLADKLDKNELTDQQKQALAESLKQAAQQYDKKQQEQKDKTQQQREDMENEIRRLQKQKDDAKTPEEQQDADRRLKKKKDDLERLNKQEDEREQSAQREALKRLHRDMEQAAENLDQKKDDQKKDDPKDGDKQDGQKSNDPSKQAGNDDQGDQQGNKQASQKLKDAARETGRVDQERRKQGGQKKVASQMEDLREAMRRAKRKGNKGPGDPFDQRGQGQGGKGQQAGKGQGKGKGQGQGQGGQGQGQEGQGDGQGDGQGNGHGGGKSGDGYGDEHDDNLVGEATGKSGDTKDQDLQGVQGKGPSRRETILAAAQKGFASSSYRQVYADYKRIVEEVMRAEKVPSSYRYYVKRYFTKIKPHAMD